MEPAGGGARPSSELLEGGSSLYCGGVGGALYCCCWEDGVLASWKEAGAPGDRPPSAIKGGGPPPLGEPGLVLRPEAEVGVISGDGGGRMVVDVGVAVELAFSQS